MTVAPTAPIDRVYSSGRHLSTGSMGPAGNMFFEGILVSWSREAGRGLGNAQTKVTKIPFRACGYS